MNKEEKQRRIGKQIIRVSKFLNLWYYYGDMGMYRSITCACYAARLGKEIQTLRQLK